MLRYGNVADAAYVAIMMLTITYIRARIHYRLLWR